MYVKIRNSNAKPGENEIVVTVTKKTLIKQIKERVEQKWNYLPELQRLYYKGKQVILHKIYFSSSIEYNIFYSFTTIIQ